MDFKGKDKKKPKKNILYYGGLHWDQGGPLVESPRVNNRAELNMGERKNR